jgi:microcystin-dependent protein
MATSYTTDKKIGGLSPITGSLDPTDEFVVSKSGDTLKTTVAEVEEAMFAAKTSGGSPQSGDVVVVRRGPLIRQLETQNLIPDGSVTKEKIAAAAGIEDSKLAKITSAGKVGGGAITDGTITGSTAVNTTGAIATSSSLAAGNTTITGTLGVSGVLTASGGVSGSLLGNANTASTLQTARTIAISGDVTGTTAAFDGSANVSAVTTISNNAVTTAKIANANVTLDKLVAAVQEALVPVGGILPFGRTTAPSGWLACNGQAVARTGTYATLFAAIGTTWGAGDGSSTFNVPNLGDRYLRHAGSVFSGGVGTIQGDEVKSHAHSASTDSTGAHTHTGTTGTESVGHTHTFSGTTGHDYPDHVHWYNNEQFHGRGLHGSTGNYYENRGGTWTGGANTRHQHNFSGTTSDRSAAHTHSLSTSSNGAHSHAVTVNNTGGTENRPHSATVLYCIKF